jgi:Na+/melibiose symporter-like transporter
MAILRKNRVSTPTSSPSRNDVSIKTPAPVQRSTSTGVSKNNNKFNPRLIFSQIVALQSLNYLVLSFMFQMNSVLYGYNVTIDRIFTAKHLNLWTKEGRIDAMTIIFSSLVGSLLMVVVVEKSKKCLDFATTNVIVHFIICVLYGGMSVLHSLDFWIVHVFGVIVMVILGEYLCSKMELMDIPLL